MKASKLIKKECPCGNIFNTYQILIDGGRGKFCSKQCAIKYRDNKIDLMGQSFGKLTVVEYAGLDKYKCALWECRCECGNTKVIESQSLIKGNTKSCGCIRYDKLKMLPNANHGRDNVKIICGVYKITNPKGEIYIGSSRTIYRRWLRHREARKNVPIHNSIAKYGWKAHKWEIIDYLPQDISDIHLINHEQVYIDAYTECGFTMLNVFKAGHYLKKQNT